jgi:hypothetical protein
MVANADESSRDALLLDPGTRVTCPKCEHEFSLEEGFAKKSLEAIESASADALASVKRSVAASIEGRLNREAAEREQQSQGELLALKKLLKDRDEHHADALKEMQALEKGAADAQLKRLQEMLSERDSQLETASKERQALAAKAKSLAEQEASLGERVEREAVARAAVMVGQAQASLEEQLKSKDLQIETFQTNELQLRRERQALEAGKQQLELDVQRKLDEQKREIEERVRAGEAEKSKLREADLQKTIDDMREKLEEAQRKSEQGSQQSQGEVLELLLESELAEAFPFDAITEVKKGVRGGDAVHTVTTRSGQVAGVVLWEAKRAQNWSRQWPAKLKSDMRECGAVIGVIVTTTFPPDWPEGRHFGLHEDVWLTSAAAAIPLAAVLREGVLDAHKARVASANKGEKMEAVYDYLTSPQFAHKLKAVYEVFGKLRAELNSERTVMQQRWKRREKQIELATVQLIGIAGDLQGLAQQDLPQLELEPKEIEELADEEAGDDAVEGEGDEDPAEE